MKKGVRKGLAVILAICFSMVSAMIPVYGENNLMVTALDHPHESSQQEMETNRFIIKYKKNHQRKEKKMAVEKVKNKGKLIEIEGNQDLKLMLTDKKMKKKDLIHLLKSDNKDTHIEYIQPDYPFTLESNDPYYPEQWGFGTVSDAVYGTVTGTVYANDATGLFEDRIHANVSAAWQSTEGEGSIVAVIDTGVDIHHEDLKDNIWVNEREIAGNGRDEDGNGYIDDVYGWNFSNNTHKVYEEGAQSQEAHGTHVAGIIAAVKDNEKGIAGVAPKAKIMVLKVFNNGTAYTSDIIHAIHYAEAMGAKIVNCSWGSMEENPALEETIRESKMLFIAAAGNQGMNMDERPVYPASYNFDNVVAVGALDRKARLQVNSNYGPGSIDAAAPGEEIISTIPGDRYEKKTGTSMAAAFASGEAALLYSKYGDIGAKAIKDRIMQSSDQLNSLKEKVQDGNLINAYNGVNAFMGQEITISGYSGEETVTGAVYQSGFTTFGAASYSNPQIATGTVISMPPGSASGKMDVKVQWNNYTNLLGSHGDCEDASKYSDYSITHTLDQANKVFGKSGIKAVINTGSPWGALVGNSPYAINLFDPNKYYFMSSYLKNGNAARGVAMRFFTNGVNGTMLDTNRITDTSKFNRVGLKLKPADWGTNATMVSFETPFIEGSGGQYGYVDGIMLIEITKEEYDTMTVDQLLAKYPYINNKALALPVRLKSVGKNIFDGATYKIDQLINNEDGSITVPENLPVAWYTSKSMAIRVQKNTNYTISVNNRLNYGRIAVIKGDATRIVETENSFFSILGIHTNQFTFNTGEYDTISIAFCSDHTSINRNAFTFKLQIEKGIAATAYEPYKESTVHPIPDTQTSLQNIIKANKLPIIGYENGTLYIDRAIKDMDIYKSTGLSVKNTALPIQAVESVYKVTENAKIPVDLSKVRIASNKLSFTIDGAKSGERYEYVYLYNASLGTLPMIEFSAPLNTEAQIEGNTDMIQGLLQRIELLEEKVRLLEKNGAGAGGSGVVRYEYDANGRLILRKSE